MKLTVEEFLEHDTFGDKGRPCRCAICCAFRRENQDWRVFRTLCQADDQADGYK